MPCRNEEGNLPRYGRELFPALDALGVPYEVVLIDDGSDDGTAAAAEALARERPGLKLVRLSPNRGLGGALRAGFAVCEGEWIATLDADLTFSPRDLTAMLDAARKTGADLVAGSPYLRRGDLAGVSAARSLPSLMINAFYRGLFGMSLTAYTPIFRLYRASRLDELPLRADGFEINAEIAALAQLARWKVAEVPTALTTRVAGVSKLDRFRELSRHAKLVARLILRSAS